MTPRSKLSAGCTCSWTVAWWLAELARMANIRPVGPPPTHLIRISSAPSVRTLVQWMSVLVPGDPRLGRSLLGGGLPAPGLLVAALDVGVPVHPDRRCFGCRGRCLGGARL